MWYNARMGLVKTRRLAAMHPPSLTLWRTRKRQRAKAAVKPPMKSDLRRITNRPTMAAMREAERIADNPFVPKYSTRESLVRSLDA